MKTSEKVHEITHLFQVNWQKSMLNFFITYFNYDPIQYQYWSQLKRDLLENLVQRSLEVFLNGMMMFIGLYWLWSFYRIMFMGTFFGWWEIPFQVISLGMFSTIVRKMYKYFKEGWKK